jgi:hypothetical protein
MSAQFLGHLINMRVKRIVARRSIGLDALGPSTAAASDAFLALPARAYALIRLLPNSAGLRIAVLHCAFYRYRLS